MTALGERMKQYEAAARQILPPRTHAIIRVDGRAFHSYLRGCEKPFDHTFMEDMNAVSRALCKEISGAVFAYTQSDEISVLVSDMANENTQQWFGGVVQKMASVSASIATAHLCHLRDSLATFDARVFVIPSAHEVGNYFIWRQQDCVRNSILMTAQAHFSHKQLQGKNCDQMQEMLFQEKCVNWSDLPDSCKSGRLTFKRSGEQKFTYTHKKTGEQCTSTAMRSWWETQPAQNFASPTNRFSNSNDRFVDSLVAGIAIEVTKKEKKPCPEGFHWIRQSWDSCGSCGLPAKAYAGLAVPKSRKELPFGKVEWKVDPWKPGDVGYTEPK